MPHKGKTPIVHDQYGRVHDDYELYKQSYGAAYIVFTYRINSSSFQYE